MPLSNRWTVTVTAFCASGKPAAEDSAAEDAAAEESAAEDSAVSAFGACVNPAVEDSSVDGLMQRRNIALHMEMCIRTCFCTCICVYRNLCT